MQSATPHWALSGGVIKAFKHHHPLSLHMSALQHSGVHVISIVLPCLFFFPSLFLTNAVGAANRELGPPFIIWSYKRSCNSEMGVGRKEEGAGGKVAAVLNVRCAFSYFTVPHKINLFHSVPLPTIKFSVAASLFIGRKFSVKHFKRRWQISVTFTQRTLFIGYFSSQFHTVIEWQQSLG